MTSEKKQEYTRRITNASKSGLVVIIYDMLLDYLEDAKNAVKQQDYEALSEAIERFLDLSAEERVQMGKLAREKMEKEFDRKLVISSYMEEIHKIIS